MTYRRIRIGQISRDPVVDFAVQELVRYLKQMDKELMVDVLLSDTCTQAENVLWVGLDERFTDRIPVVEDAQLDDAVFIDVQGVSGVISGSNARSVLLGVYRFLTELGCRWVRLGKEGERISEFPVENLSVFVCEAASYRHRGICIEGTCAYETVAEFIDWLPKLGMNSYFIQGIRPKVFFDFWYGHGHNPHLEKEPLTLEDVELMIRSLEREMERRGLINQRGGHGWSSEAYGIFDGGWAKKDFEELPKEYRDVVALIDGERKLWMGTPTNTNLCYSKKEVRARIIDEVVRYCNANPSAQTLHFWLGDMFHNHCECEDCREMRPADWYVRTLNELDERLCQENLQTRIVFLLYYDLLWAPSEEKILNQDRFILMFAPVSRIYGKTFADALPCDETPAEYELNKSVMPASLKQNIAHLQSWQKEFSGDSFAYEYYLMWPHSGDLGYEKCARNIYDDVRDLERLSVNGMISVQVQRAFYPTALPNYVLGKALWNKDVSYEDTVSEYYSAAFGEDGEKVHTYLQTLSHALTLYNQGSFGDKEHPYGPYCSDYEAVYKLLADFVPVIKENCVKDNIYKNHWDVLLSHNRYAFDGAHVLELQQAQKTDEAKEAVEALRESMRLEELELRHVLDVKDTPRTFARKARLLK